MSADADVIIVGAGAAGLSAAKVLAKLGLTYRIVEAADRIGGRASSVEIGPGEWFDRGCAWLVGGEDNPFTSLARDLGFDLSTEKRKEFDFDALRFVRNGEHLGKGEHAACVRYHDKCEAAISAAAAEGRDVALSEIIEYAGDAATPFLTSVDTSMGRSIDQISSTDYASCVGDLGYQVPRGYGSLVAAWGSDMPVSLDTRVDRIDWSRAPVSVETTKGTITGKVVLLTVSTGVLGNEQITFRPALPDWKTEAIQALPMGTENKIGLHFDGDVFGPEGRAYYTVWRSGGDAAKVDASVMGLNTAVVFVGCALAVSLENEGAKALESFAMEKLTDIFGTAIRKRHINTLTTAWHSDPHTRGSWACAMPGQAHQRINLEESIEGRLFFAGEATTVGPQGTCHGAYLSGQKAARKIADALATAKAGLGVS